MEETIDFFKPVRVLKQKADQADAVDNQPLNLFYAGMIGFYLSMPIALIGLFLIILFK